MLLMVLYDITDEVLFIMSLVIIVFCITGGSFALSLSTNSSFLLCTCTM